jgi:hypothetical protein
MTDRIDAMSDDVLAALPDEELEMIAATAILDAAIMNGTRWAAKYHDRCDRVYDECARRKRGIYGRAWNSAVLSQGHRRMVQAVPDESP